jgi:hypothetical protein
MSISYSGDYVPRADDHYRVIILIIASSDDGGGYDQFKEYWRLYMNRFSGIRSFFIYSDPTIGADMHVTNDSISHRSIESLRPGIFYKTIAAMSVCSELFKYDYILRTNLSSFIHIPRLLMYLDTQRLYEYAGGHFNNLPDHQNKIYEHSVVNKYTGVKMDSKFVFLHGACFILSRDLITRLLGIVDNKPERVRIAENAFDDVAISLLLNDCVVRQMNCDGNYIPNEFVNLYANKYQCKTVEDPEVYGADENIFHFRNKTSDDEQYSDRDTDLSNYMGQIRYFYGIS